MTDLKGYLEKYHLETNFEDLTSDFMDKFGIGVKKEDDLYQFKYNQLAAKWNRDLTHQCRGVILRKTDKWQYVSRPFDKFFNQHEGYCPVFQENDFNSRVNDLWIVEKADGTCIQLWYDNIKSKYRVSTLGTITTMNVQDYDITFEDLFWETLAININESNMDLFNKNMTYIFELCCLENRILTKYPENVIFLLGARNIESGNFSCKEEQEKLVENAVLQGLKLKMPYYEHMTNSGINNLFDMKKFVHDAISMTDMFGDFPEGFVIYDGLKPIAKMKNEQYLSLHHVAGGDRLHTRNVIIDSYFANTIDDLYAHLDDRFKEFADSLKKKVESLFLRMQHTFSSMDAKLFETQKDYAIFIQGNADKEFWAFFFQNKEKLLDSTVDKMDLFTNWLSVSYKKFLDYWKGQ